MTPPDTQDRLRLSGHARADARSLALHEAVAARVLANAAVLERARRRVASWIIDGSIGELSAFHDTFGYYAQDVGPETATLPAGWVDRIG